MSERSFWTQQDDSAASKATRRSSTASSALESVLGAIGVGEISSMYQEEGVAESSASLESEPDTKAGKPEGIRPPPAVARDGRQCDELAPGGVPSGSWREAARHRRAAGGSPPPEDAAALLPCAPESLRFDDDELPVVPARAGVEPAPGPLLRVRLLDGRLLHRSRRWPELTGVKPEASVRDATRAVARALGVHVSLSRYFGLWLARDGARLDAPQAHDDCDEAHQGMLPIPTRLAREKRRTAPAVASL